MSFVLAYFLHPSLICSFRFTLAFVAHCEMVRLPTIVVDVRSFLLLLTDLSPWIIFFRCLVPSELDGIQHVVFMGISSVCLGRKRSV